MHGGVRFFASYPMTPASPLTDFLAACAQETHMVIKQAEDEITADVGCHGNGSDKIQGYRAHGLRGRVIPCASGAKLANMSLHVIAVGGDGGTFSEGISHLVHAIRCNYPITFVLHDNGNYGLTTGQASSLTPQDNLHSRGQRQGSDRYRGRDRR